MKLKFTILLLIFSLPQILSQPQTYTVTKAPFSSNAYDEFSPVYYKNGIVFCTNRNPGLTNYSTSQNEGLFKIYYVDTTRKVNIRSASMFSKDLTSILNDGPASFNRTGDTVYFSRNLVVDGKLSQLSTTRNKLGIFYAVLEGKKWIRIRELRFNNEWYNVTTPALSPDGKRLYFASDKPDGYGGSDIYYSQWKNGYWDNPINPGPAINTSGNESYPFVNQAGELFFSSDGHPGLGGKDIFITKQKGNEWFPPVRLDTPINSGYDDFGIVTDPLMNKGYLSSNRDKSIDIYQFTTNLPQIFFADIQKENQYCFIFSDSGAILIDTLNLRYRWDFGDGKKLLGVKVSHCFPGPGNYDIKLDIVDKGTGNVFFPKIIYNLEIRDNEQPYISSPDFAVTGEAIDFDGLKSNFPGYKILNYTWDFGDGTRMSGEKAVHSFKEKGEYDVRLGLILRLESTGEIHKAAVSKKVLAFTNTGEKTSFLSKRTIIKEDLPDFRKYDYGEIELQYSAETEFRQDAVFQVEALSSKTKIGSNSSILRNVPSKYSVWEIFDPGTGSYSYIVDQQMTLMATYPAYRDMIANGYKDARARIYILKDPADKELLILKKNYGVLTDTYFDVYNRLMSNGYLMLDQIVILMNRHPGIKLEIGVHTDNLGVPANNLTLSQNRAQLMVNYLINRGIDSNRLIARGFGGFRPVASNIYERDRKLNRRIEFTIIN